MNLKRLYHVLTGLLIFFSVLFLSFSSAENLLDNADFLQLDEDGYPEGWYPDAYIQEKGYTNFLITDVDAEHPHALMIQNVGENDARLAQTVEVEPDSLYCLSGYIRAEDVNGGHGANLSVEGVYAFSEQLYDTDGQWKYIEYYGETGPEQESLTVFARLGGYSGTSEGKAYYSGLSLRKTDSVPGDGIADRWYVDAAYEEDDTDDEGEDESAGTSRALLVGIIFVYTAAALCLILHERNREPHELTEKPAPSAAVIMVLILSMALRLIISWYAEGYMVDVNCFLSWGQTMASVGPVRFYEATSFCDYPPLYTYVLGLNSFITQLLGGSEGVSRVIFRLIPSLCDIFSCWLLYRVLLQQNRLSARSCYLFLTFSVFNPAMILNSAAWGQMDGVLCTLLLAVSVCAVQGKWKAALPLYVIAVLVKPQALMLGPLGLIFIILTYVRRNEYRRSILTGTGFSFLVLATGLIPFSLRQNWDWIIELYGRTLASYPYATVNTANYYYLLGGNWSAIDNNAHILAPLLMSLFCAGYAGFWFARAKNLPGRLIETVISAAFSLAFIGCACFMASWAWTGGIAMAFVFFVVLSHAFRSGSIRILPWLGGLLYILLYVFGIKMHERYLFPALLLLPAAWVLLKDRRILYILLLFTFTVFLNEGIVLDNSIRLGSSLGHLNKDTVWLADLLSILNIAGSVLAVKLSVDLIFGREAKESLIFKKNPAEKWDTDRKLHWRRMDTLILSAITAFYALISLTTLGSTRAPQTTWTSSSAEEQIVFDLGEVKNDFEILYFSQVSRNDFSFSVSSDGTDWEEETWAQMDQGQCWKWKYVTESCEDEEGERIYYNHDESYIVRFTGRYIRLTAHQLGLRLNEILFREEDGTVLSASIIEQSGSARDSELFSDPAMLIDESDSMEGLPSFPPAEESSDLKVQPSWWNSTYFDEIYHARTAYEFLKGSVPYETSHPPLGKLLMSIAVAIFGMTPFGWRFAGALAGILMLPGMYLIGKQLTKKTSIATMCCLLMGLDCMHLTQTQIATIDSFPVLFIIFAFLFMLRFVQTDFHTEKLGCSLIDLGLSGFFMGLSIASKWIGIYAGAGLALLFFWHCYRIFRLYSNTQETVRKRIFIICAWCILFFVIIPMIIYLLSYIPYLAYNAKRIHSVSDYIAQVWQAQTGMFNYHSTPNLGMDHPFYSPWWEWPVIGKPMYYASQMYIPADSPVHHSIFCFGNPVIWFGGLIALVFCMTRVLTQRKTRNSEGKTAWRIGSGSFDPRYVFVAVGLLAQYLPWVLVPRGTYIYHYFASLPFLMTAISLCFDKWRPEVKFKVRIIAVLFTLAAAVFFIILFPYASGMNVLSAWLDIGRNILRIWY